MIKVYIRPFRYTRNDRRRETDTMSGTVQSFVDVFLHPAWDLVQDQPVTS